MTTTMHTSGQPGTASQIAPGDTIAARELTTIRSGHILMPAPGVLTHLQFRRYAGCPVCNLHLQSMARRHEQITASGICEIVVFHSTAADMLPHQGQLPFAVIADPSRKLYHEFGVTTSPRAVLHPRAWAAPFTPRVYPMILRGIRGGGSPAPRHGDTALGLPADFLIEPGGRVREAKYGQHASDHWTVDQLIHLARAPATAAGTCPDGSGGCPPRGQGARRLDRQGNPDSVGQLRADALRGPERPEETA